MTNKVSWMLSNLLPKHIFSFSEISLSVCGFTCQPVDLFDMLNIACPEFHQLFLNWTALIYPIVTFIYLCSQQLIVLIDASESSLKLMYVLVLLIKL